MNELPRIALGSVQPQLFLQPLLWGVLDGLRRVGVEGQVFCAQSRFDDVGMLSMIGERRLRHLDSWLMPAAVSRWFLRQGAQEQDMSIVIGRYQPSAGESTGGGSLDQLCCDLQMPSLVVVDVSTMDACCLPALPDHAQGVLLVGCAGEASLARWQTRLEALWDLPVLGGFCDPIRADLWQAAPGRVGGTDQPLVDLLGDDFLRHVNWQRLLDWARRAPALPIQDPWESWTEPHRPLRVAMAYDEVFNCYFPDTMDCLEAMGAELIDFSPLKSESLPASVDLVWLGCGHPERYAARLARNICLQQSLRAYVRAGGRVYAEGGGLAYVCETMHCDAGSFRMAGILPAEAYFEPATAHAVELELVGSPWLGRRSVRGYLNPCWSVAPRQECVDYSAGSSCPCSLVGRQSVIGSRVHLHFASQPQLLKSIWSSASCNDSDAAH